MAAGRRRRNAGGGSAADTGVGEADTGVGEADRIINAAMALTAAQGWRSVSLAAVAREAGVPILNVYRIFPSKAAILRGLFRRIDAAVLATPPDAEPGERARDRVFDLLMRRFDALHPYRAALEVLRRDLPADPLTALAAGCALSCSMRLMLEAAEIPCQGIGGVLAVKLVAAAYLAAAHTWARDESPDLAPTMATLDRRLRGIERWLASGSRSARNSAAAA